MKYVPIFLMLFGIKKIPINAFNEQNIPTKARPIQMNQELLDYCKKEITGLLEK
jgi:hypothetical protein